MSELQVETKRGWALTQSAFRRLLGWLDEGRDSDGRNYLEMRRRLVAYFDRKNCSTPDELADETLNRVARRLEEEGISEGEAPARYCYIVARFVFMEHLRAGQKAGALLEDVDRRHARGLRPAAPEAGGEAELKERMLVCLERCANELDLPARELITRYYSGGRSRIESRRAQAAELGITVNALSIRACRIRARLEECVSRCAAGG